MLKQTLVKLPRESAKSDILDSFGCDPCDSTTNPENRIQFTSTCNFISSGLHVVKRKSRAIFHACIVSGGDLVEPHTPFKDVSNSDKQSLPSRKLNFCCAGNDSTNSETVDDADCKPKGPDVLEDPFDIDKIGQDGLVFRQNFSIRSYETGPDKNAFTETLMQYLQETALNHVKTVGLLEGGFGSTLEMCKRNLIWVVSKMQLLVDHYPTWGDVVEIETWVAASGKNGMRRDWLLRDSQTREILTRASGECVMINKETRKLAKFPDEVRAEISSYFLDLPPIVDQDSRKLPKLDDKSANNIRSGLTPRWYDLDVNLHVNNAKYVGWIFESVPVSLFESHELAALTLEYRRECLRDSVVQSLTSVLGNDCGNFANAGFVECQHLLRLESGAEILKGRTKWRPKCVKRIGSVGELPAERA